MSKIDVKFWDGYRYYRGTARELSEEYVVAEVRISDLRHDVTILPKTDIIDLVTKHLKGRVVPFEIGHGEIRGDLLAKLENIVRVPGSSRRVRLTATFHKPGKRDKGLLSKLLVETQVRRKAST